MTERDRATAMVTDTTVSERLRLMLVARRHEIGMTQQQLADRLGMRWTSVSDLETGRSTNYRIGILVRWAAALDYPLYLELGPKTVYPPELGDV